MAISVLKYPSGGFLATAGVTATASNGAPEVRINKTSHGLVTGDHVYIYGPVDTYNGYWYVSTGTANFFFISPLIDPTGIYQTLFTTACTLTYYPASGNQCFWHSVHLPIIYKLKSDVWPINGVDTARTITSFSNWNGYTALVLSGDIKATGTASTLESVILSGTGTNAITGETSDGVYRIIQWSSDTSIVIDLLYSGSNVLSSGTCQYYYLNYHAKVKIYAGLTGTHTWASEKPYTLIDTVRLVPDASGIMTLNVSEYAKNQIEIFSNNLQLYSLPNNLDAWCRLYISYAESYDDSNMYTVSEYVSSYTDDTTAVYAVNAKLPFKNRQAGVMNGYVSVTGGYEECDFLSPFTRPTLFVGNYFDVSFIGKHTTTGNDLYLKIDRYENTNGNYVLSSSALSSAYSDVGVFRYQVTQSGTEDRIDITIIDSGNATISQTKTIDVVTNCDQYDTPSLYLTWMNYLGGYDYWLFTAQKLYSVDVVESKTQTNNIYNNYPDSYGEFGQSIDNQSIRRTKNTIRMTSQLLTQAQCDALAWIVSSPLVQIMTTNTVSEQTIPTQRTVIVDSNTLKKRQDRDNTFSISFNITYTDELPVQSL